MAIYKFTGKRISIIIVENHYVTLAGIDLLLSNLVDFEIVGRAAGSDESIELAKSVRADVILYDLHVPGSKVVEEIFGELSKTGAKIIISPPRFAQLL